MNVQICKLCKSPRDSPDQHYVCSACSKKLLAKIYNLATVKFALTITGWVIIASVIAVMVAVYATQPDKGTFTFWKKRGGTVEITHQAFLLIGISILAGAGGLLYWSRSTGRRISQLEAEYQQATGTRAVYDIRTPKPK